VDLESGLRLVVVMIVGLILAPANIRVGITPTATALVTPVVYPAVLVATRPGNGSSCDAHDIFIGREQHISSPVASFVFAFDGNILEGNVVDFPKSMVMPGI
jgi:hypothetical protein